MFGEIWNKDGDKLIGKSAGKTNDKPKTKETPDRVLLSVNVCACMEVCCILANNSW